MQYRTVGQNGSETMVVLVEGQMLTVPSSHLHYDTIKEYLRDGGSDAQYVRTLLDVRGEVTRGMRRLSDRVAVVNDQITFDGDAIDTALSRHLLRLLREGSDAYRPVVAFMENLSANPSPLSRRHLWSWLHAQDFSLTPDGCVIGYKAVNGDYSSINSGREDVEVNGHIYRGHVPNEIGATVSMPRSIVDPDREHACAVGLHVGTWDYARDFGGDTKVLTVSVNPRDVVAVPRDHGDQKMRVCRYTVLSVAPARHESALVRIAYDGVDEEYNDEYV